LVARPTVRHGSLVYPFKDAGKDKKQATTKAAELRPAELTSWVISEEIREMDKEERYRQAIAEREWMLALCHAIAP